MSNDAPNSATPQIQPPPQSFRKMMLYLGPGLIIAGNIVGSGELIATTQTGAQAGFWLLWLIFIGCIIKVFTQVELGRFTIIRGKTTMAGLNEVPGPRIGKRGNWLVWYWLAMFLVSLGQLGGIVGGVGQALSITIPLTENGKKYNEIVDARTDYLVKKSLVRLLTQGGGSADIQSLHDRILELDTIDRSETAAIKKADSEGTEPPKRDYAARLTIADNAAAALPANAESAPATKKIVEYLGEVRTRLKELVGVEIEPTSSDDKIWA
ncbi:MAG: hypothetical protein AAF517_27595, partial [Planctomycetota bacterium]